MSGLLCTVVGVILAAATAYHEFWYARDHARHGPADWIAALALAVTVGLIPVLRREWRELQEEGVRRARLSSRLERD